MAAGEFWPAPPAQAKIGGVTDTEVNGTGPIAGVEEPEYRDPDASGFTLLKLDRVLFPGRTTYTTEELAAAAGIDPAVAQRLWGAMGFPPPPPDEAVFVDDDLAALRLATRALEALAPLDEIVYQTRVMAASLSRVAEVVADDITRHVAELRQSGVSEEEISAMITAGDAKEINQLIGYVYRRQLRAALWRKLADPQRLGEPATLAVGFVDLVRFTALTEDIAEEQLADLIDRFESVVHDQVTGRGGRIVKMIGDEVMFVTEDAFLATQIALDLVRAFHVEDAVPPARAGLAHGPVLAHGGDYFGPVVNLASRIVDVARPSTVVVSQDIHDQLADRPELSWRRIPPKRLKGIGRTPLWAVF